MVGTLLFLLANAFQTPLPPAAVLSGRITDQRTGQPLAGVTVTAIPASAGRGRPLFGGRPVQHPQAVSDAQGNFIFTLPAGAYQLQTESETHSGQVLVTGQAGGPPVAIALQRDTILSGVVLDADGKPAEGALVQAFARPPFGQMAPAMVSAARSGPDGRYQLRHLTEGKYLIAARALMPGQLPTMSLDEGNPKLIQEVTLSPGEQPAQLNLVVARTTAVKVSGRIRPWPIPGVQEPMFVLLEQDSGPSVMPQEVQPDGRFAFPAVTAGTYSLESTIFRNGDPVKLSADVVVSASDITGLELGLDQSPAARPAAVLMGRVIGAKPALLRGIQIYLNSYEPGSGFGPVQADAEGRFAIAVDRPARLLPMVSQLPAGHYVQAVRYGASPTTQPLDLRQKPWRELVIEVADGAGQLAGRVFRQGQPLAAVKVSLLGPHDELLVGETAADGTYTVSGLAPGDYRVHATVSPEFLGAAEMQQLRQAPIGTVTRFGKVKRDLTLP